MTAVGEAVRRERPGRVVIMRAAIMEMGEQGYEGASMRDMAARAGVTVAALYYHFPSKRELLGEFLDEAYDVIEARLDRRLATAPAEPVAQLDELVATLIASYTHDEYARRASLVALREYIRVDDARRRSVDAKRERIVDRARDIIGRGVASGAFATDDTDEAARTVVALCGTTVEVVTERAVTVADVIDTHRRFARSIAQTRLGDDLRPGAVMNGSLPSPA